ncbi:zinc finger-like domain-containing protein [Aeromonas veronii]|uniref:zinc finger-like domain-containing protein n=1 Tax=Aeromonas veronii TaxID=654 RepID=UPI002F421EC7
MKRYNCTLSDKRGAFGLCMEEHKEGAFVPFSEVEQLQAKIFELLEKFHRTGVAIERAISTGSVLADHPLKSRLELLANHHEREMELAAQLSDATRQCGVMADLLREARTNVDQVRRWGRFDHDEGCGAEAALLLERIEAALAGNLHICQSVSPLLDRIGLLTFLLRELRDGVEGEWCFPGNLDERIDAALAGTLQEPTEQHHDDAAVDRFVVAMKAKLAAAREKGRGGWDDPNACSVEYLADLLVNHVAKGNAGTFEDVANFAMMLHQRGADPAVLAHSATMTTCSRCKGHGMIGGVTGQTPESMDFWEAECPDCYGRGKVKLKGRAITEGQEIELVTVLQSIVNGFSDDPAHDAAALLKRITGEVPWTGDSFQLPSRQGGEPCATEPPSSSQA